MHKYLIYMASGNSSRFGENKLLFKVQGKPLFTFGLEALRIAAERSGNCTLIVVSRYPEIRAYAEEKGICTADCPESVNGASYTLRAGIQSIEDLQEADYLLFAAADQPCLNPDSVCSILAKADGKTETARLFWEDTPGNPVLFSAKLVPELLALQGDQGGGAVVKRHSCIPVPVQDPREFWDLDREADLEKFLNL